MIQYELIENQVLIGADIIKATLDNGEVKWIPTDPANSDYQAYLTKDEVKADEAKAK
jgi:hypothetical protein